MTTDTKTAPKSTSKQKTGTTYISFLLDRTGSMSVVRDATISGFNEFVRSQRLTPGKTRWTLNLFDSHPPEPVVQPVFEGRKGREVPDLTTETYVPRGMTPLYDAVGQTLTSAIAHAKDLRRMSERMVGSVLRPWARVR